MLVLIENWWTVAVRGIVAILFGLVAFFLPGVALTYLVLLFGCYALLDGIFTLTAGFGARRKGRRSWILVFLGLVGVTAGVLTFVYPLTTAIALLGFIATWAIITGIFEIVAAVQLRKEITGEWMLALDGIISTILGLGIIIAPMLGALVLVWWLGAYATVSGIILIALAMRLRKVETLSHLQSPQI